MIKLSFLIAGHTGWHGHKIKSSTLSIIKERLIWRGMDKDVESFVTSCINCLITESGERVSRP